MLMSQRKLLLRKPLRKGNSSPLGYSRRYQNGCASQTRGVCTAWGPGHEPLVAAEARMQEQDTYVEILHWNMMALYSLQLMNFEKDVRSSLVIKPLPNFF